MSHSFPFYCYCTSYFKKKCVCMCILSLLSLYPLSLCVVCTHVCSPEDNVRYLDNLIYHFLLYSPETGSQTELGICHFSMRLASH